MLYKLLPQRTREESGFAMVLVLVVMTVSLLLVAVLLSQGEHLDRSTFRDRKWHTALQVAEAGVQRTIVELKSNFSYGGITAATHVPGGDFETSVAPDTAFGPGRRTITSTAYVPNKGHRNEVRRRVKVTIGPPPALLYALFSETCMVVENNADPVKGDVFANFDITLSNNTIVQGDVVSSRGVIDMQSGSSVIRNGPKGGSIFSGGKASVSACGKTGAWGINMDNGSAIQGGAHAQRDCSSPSPPSPPLEYGIKGNSGNGGADIGGNAVAWGSIGPNVAGTKTFFPAAGACEPRPLLTTSAPPFKAKDASEGMFNFYTNAFAGSSPAVTIASYADANAFQAWANGTPTSLTGVHLVDLTSDSTQVIDLSGKRITDTFILVTPTLVKRDNSFSTDFYNGPNFGGTRGIVQIVSLRNPTTAPGITFADNSLNIVGQPCMLFYSTGTVEMKNNALVYGAVYGSDVQLKNGFKVVFDKCVQRSLGFGDKKAVQNVFREVTPS